MTIEVELAIDSTSISEGQTTATITARLVSIGGTMLSYKPALRGAPATARFTFETESERNRFALKALKIPGVSLVTTV